MQMCKMAAIAVVASVESASADVTALFTERESDILLEFSGSLDIEAFGTPTVEGNILIRTALSGSEISVGPCVNAAGLAWQLGDFFQSVGPIDPKSLAAFLAGRASLYQTSLGATFWSCPEAIKRAMKLTAQVFLQALSRRWKSTPRVLHCHCLAIS